MADYPKHLNQSSEIILQAPADQFLTKKSFLFSFRLYRLIRILLGGIFLWSGFVKLLEPAYFAVIIEAFGLIPESWVMPVAVGLPALEVIAAIGLLLDIQGSLAVIAGMLALFMVVLAYGIWLGLDIDCGCFGPEDPEPGIYHSLRPALFRDVVMMAGIIFLYVWRYSRSVKPVRFLELI